MISRRFILLFKSILLFSIDFKIVKELEELEERVDVKILTNFFLRLYALTFLINSYLILDLILDSTFFTYTRIRYLFKFEYNSIYNTFIIVYFLYSLKSINHEV